jgi:hypothetical protein
LGAGNDPVAVAVEILHLQMGMRINEHNDPKDR